jgi:hypothetical protein
VTDAELVAPPADAAIVAVPPATAVTVPSAPTVATASAELDQATGVAAAALPSARRTSAVSLRVLPESSVTDDGLTTTVKAPPLGPLGPAGDAPTCAA